MHTHTHAPCQEAKHLIAPDSYVIQILGLSDREFKIVVTNMLRALMKKVDNMREKTTKFSIEMETIGKERVETHNWKIVTEVRISFYRLIYKL